MKNRGEENVFNFQSIVVSSFGQQKLSFFVYSVQLKQCWSPTNNISYNLCIFILCSPGLSHFSRCGYSGSLRWGLAQKFPLRGQAQATTGEDPKYGGFPSHRGTPNWLVVWLPFFIFPYIGLLIIPIDVHIFQRGGPTTNQPIIIHF